MQLALLDTDILSEFLKQKNPAVLKNAADYLADFQQFAISAMTRYEVMRGLKDKGASHRDPDLIIAATALEHGRVLVTGNTSDFAWIPGLIIEDWCIA